MRINDLAVERRKKMRFPVNRELRYKVLEDEVTVESGMGTTFDMGSGGVGFHLDHELEPGAFIELSISWPVLLGDSCPMRMIVFGRVLRSTASVSVCSIDKHEFRTQARVSRPVVPIRGDSMLQRWAGAVRKENMKSASA
jgi:PilZ domain